jgi:hypothetical protein
VDFITGLFVALLSLMMLASLLASIPLYIMINTTVKGSQAFLITAFQTHQEQMLTSSQEQQRWMIEAISQMTEHQTLVQQKIFEQVFSEMRYLSGKIPTVSVASPPRSKPTIVTSSLDPAPFLEGIAQ